MSDEKCKVQLVLTKDEGQYRAKVGLGLYPATDPMVFGRGVGSTKIEACRDALYSTWDWVRTFGDGVDEIAFRLDEMELREIERLEL